MLAGAKEELWALITLGASENAVWTEVVGLFRDDVDDDTTQPQPSFINDLTNGHNESNGLKGVYICYVMHCVCCIINSINTYKIISSTT